jgi:hypothetical protein
MVCKSKNQRELTRLMLYTTLTGHECPCSSLGGRIFGAQGLKLFEQSFCHPAGSGTRRFRLEIGNFNARSLRLLARTVTAAQGFAARVDIKCTVNFCSRHFRATLGIFPGDSTHLTKIEEAKGGGASLDSLSVRCLSSYLFFPPV